MNQRIQNTLTGLMFVGWALLRVLTAEACDRWTIGQLIPAMMHLVVAVLFWKRQPERIDGSVASIVWSLPSFIVGGLAINLATAPHLWSIGAQSTFALGALGAMIGMLFLGGSFAIFPAVRPIVKRGPFRLIRHPIYFCELIMIAGCCAAGDSLMNWSLMPVGVLAIVLRIVFEERLLEQSDAYLKFCQETRYRLVPMIW